MAKTSKKKKKTTVSSKHRHCSVCGISVPANARFCGEGCQNEYQKYRGKRKWTQILTIVAPIVVIVALLAYRYFFQ